jgi:hypothetical protein
MMQERPIRPQQAIKPEIEVSAGGKATITSLPIITSWDYRYSLSDLQTWLVYLQKIIEHNEPFMPALMKAPTYITVHYRNGIHASSRCMDSVQPHTPSVWMECILASHIRHVECTCIKHVVTTQLITRREDGIHGMDHSINPRNSRDAVQHTYKTRGSSSLVVQESKSVLTVKFRQPSHEFTFGVGMNFISYPLVLTPVV